MATSSNLAPQHVQEGVPQQSHCVFTTFWAQHEQVDSPQQPHGLDLRMASFMVTTVIPDEVAIDVGVAVVSHGQAPLHVPHGGGAMEAFRLLTICGRLNAGSLLQHEQVATPQQPQGEAAPPVLASAVTTVWVGTCCTTVTSFPLSKDADEAAQARSTSTATKLNFFHISVQAHAA